MHVSPRLTIGIPTIGARPERLAKAIQSALGQQVPAKVLIADQCKGDDVRQVVDSYKLNPLVRYVQTYEHAECLQDNWRLALESCDTEFFAWLQDDDLLAPHFARRVIAAFDAYPSSLVYLARLSISITEGLGNWWQGTGPMVPMDLLYGSPTQIKGDLLIAGAWFTSFALSPGVAIRVRPDTVEAVGRVPKDCELFAERLVLAELGALGPAVCDPATVGYWVQHEGNKSRQLNADDLAIDQYPIMARRLSQLLAGRQEWLDKLGAWAICVGQENLVHWLRNTDRHALDDGPAELIDARRVLFHLSGVKNDAEKQVAQSRPRQVKRKR